MSCLNTQELIPQLLDRELAGREREEVLQHLAECRECSSRHKSLQDLRGTLRQMQAVSVPPQLAVQLRVTASRERDRALNRGTMAQRFRHWADCSQLMLDNLMRPMALPFAGGILSTLVLFFTLAPTFVVQRNYANDVPTALFTDPSLEEIGHYHSPPDETVLLLSVDERGRVSNFTVPQGSLTPEMLSDLLLYRFAPATAFGLPTSGRVTVTFRRSAGGNHIVVRG
jgi:anti-sigma factor RsiW